MYWVIVACPEEPSFFRLSSRGITTVSNCRMIELVM